jgi:quercetin dioxygenase-like cupin family protein
LDILVSKITLVQPGTSGWHSHPGGAIVIVQAGEITLYRSVRKGEDDNGQSQSNEERGGRSPHCVITKYTVGQSFVERPGEVVDAVNTGSTDVTLVAVFPGVPVGVVGGQRIDQPNPGTCGI